MDLGQRKRPNRWIRSAHKHFSNRHIAAGHQCRGLSVPTSHNSPTEGLRQGCKRESGLCWILSFAAVTLPAPLSWATCRDEHRTAQVKPDVHINSSWQCSQFQFKHSFRTKATDFVHVLASRETQISPSSPVSSLMLSRWHPDCLKLTNQLMGAGSALPFSPPGLSSMCWVTFAKPSMFSLLSGEEGVPVKPAETKLSS